MTPLLIFGAGGQARWAAEIAALRGFEPVMAERADEATALASGRFSHAHVAIGGEHEMSVRIKPCLRETIMNRFARQYPKIKWPAMIHPSSWVSPDVVIEDGVEILAQCSIGPKCHVMRGAIMASGSLLEHDSIMEPFAYLTTGAATGGGVTIGARSFIGTNAVIKHGLTVPPDCLIGAGVTLNVKIDGPSILAPGKPRIVKRRAAAAREAKVVLAALEVAADGF